MKKSLLLLAAPFLAMGITACGGGGTTSEPASSSQPSSSVAPSSSEAPSSEPAPSSSEASTSEAPSSADTSATQATSTPTGALTVKFWHTFGQKNGEALAKTARAFEALVKENMDVDVTIDLQYLGAYGDIYNNITKNLATGSQPTMAIAYPDHVASYIASEGDQPGRFVVNLDDFMNDPEIGLGTQDWLGDFDEFGDPYDEEDFVETYIDEGRHFIREGTYTFPFMKSSEVLFYNLEATQRAFKGWKPEITTVDALEEYMNEISWDEFMDLCEYVNENKATVLNTIKTPLYYDSDGNFFISKMFQNEIPYSSIDPETHMGKVDFESGQARTDAEAMVKTLKAQFDKGTFRTKGTEGTYGSDSFKSGESVFTVGSTGGTGYNMPSGDIFHVGVCPVPKSNDNPLYVTQGPSLTFFNASNLSEAENQATLEMAWMFAKYLTNPDVNVYQCTYGSEGYTPVRYSAYETEEYQEFIEDPDDIFAKTGRLLTQVIGDSYFNTAVFPGSAELRDQSGGILTKVFSKEGADDAFITTAFAEAINTAKTKFR